MIEDEDAAPDARRLSWRLALGYNAANLGFGAFYALNNAVLPLFLARLTRNAVVILLLGSTHSIEGALIQPLVGSASDRLRTRLGRRRPFLLACIPVSALFLCLTPAAAALPERGRLAAVVAAIVLFTVFFNVAQDPYNALMPDITPAAQRGRMVGVGGFVMVLGQIGLLALPISTPAKMYTSAALMLATTLVTCAMVREPVVAARPVAPTWSADLRAAVRGLRSLPQLRRYLAVGFCTGVGVGAVLPGLTRFTEEVTHCTDLQAQAMFLILMAATALGVLPCGWLADRFGPKRVLLAGLGLITMAAALALTVGTLAQIGVVMALAGLGNAAQTASAYPLLTRIAPAGEIGFYTGLQATILSVATPLTAVAAGTMINHGGYRLIFAWCAVGVGVGWALLTQVDVEAGSQDAAR